MPRSPKSVPGYKAEYRKRHDNCRPRMLHSLHQSAIRNCTIFRQGLTLSRYVETDDLEEAKALLASSPVNANGEEWMAPIVKIAVDPSTQFPHSRRGQFILA